MATGAPGPDQRERFRRRLIVGIGLLLMVNVLGFAVAWTVTNSDEDLPNGIVSLVPAEGSVSGPLAPIGIDLDARYTFVVDMTFDGRPLPNDQFDQLSPGQFRFRPAPGKEFDRFPPGRHVLVASYASSDPEGPVGTVSWEITVG